MGNAAEVRIAKVPSHKGHYLGDGSATHESTACSALPVVQSHLLLLRAPWHVLVPGKRAKSAPSLEQQPPRSSWQMGRSPDRSEPAGGIETDGFTDFSKNQSES